VRYVHSPLTEGQVESGTKALGIIANGSGTVLAGYAEPGVVLKKLNASELAVIDMAVGVDGCDPQHVL